MSSLWPAALLWASFCAPLLLAAATAWSGSRAWARRLAPWGAQFGLFLW